MDAGGTFFHRETVDKTLNTICSLRAMLLLKIQGESKRKCSRLIIVDNLLSKYSRKFKRHEQ